MRLQKYLSEQGILSRRKTEEFIRAGKILINGKPAKIGAKIDPRTDKIEIVGGEKNFETVLINKPRDIVSSKIKKEGKTVFELFPEFGHLHIAGRLDKESEGLLVLTNDGVLAKKLTGAGHTIEKEYKVSVRENVIPGALKRLEHGVRLSDGMTLPVEVKKTGTHEFSIILKEGRNHQIRRMADVINLTVTRLVRTRIGNITIGSLKTGASRELSSKETESLKKL